MTLFRSKHVAQFDSLSSNKVAVGLRLVFILFIYVIILLPTSRNFSLRVCGTGRVRKDSVTVGHVGGTPSPQVYFRCSVLCHCVMSVCVWLL